VVLDILYASLLFVLIFFGLHGTEKWVRWRYLEKATVLSLRMDPERVVSEFCTNPKPTPTVLSCTLEMAVNQRGRWTPICTVAGHFSRYRLRYYQLRSSCQLGNLAPFWLSQKIVYSDFS
jgi:hypothetical protein